LTNTLTFSMKVAIYGQVFAGQEVTPVLELLEELRKVSAQVVIEENFHEFLSQSLALGGLETFTLTRGLDSSFDLFVSFGGDGTVLRAVTYIKNLGIPIVGINTGRLGFLATFGKDQTRKVVTEFMNGSFSIEERSLVQIELEEDPSGFGHLNFALNEITVSRKDTTSMITVATYLDGEYLTSYWADGLIVATPTGSTGYSLSCGGPVITPTTKSLVLTPIAPHNLNARPLVIPDDTEIRLVASGREENHLVSLDSRIGTVPNGQELVIRKADFSLPMLEYQSGSFFNTLRSKLLWGQDQRN